MNSSNGPARSAAVVSIIGIAILAAAQLGGCAGDTTVSDRPMLGPSVAEAHGADAESRLDFLDGLEARTLVSHDDAVCAVLLLTAKKTYPTYDARIGAAKEMGILDSGFSRPGREATTVGDVAVMLNRSLGAGPEVSESQAMSELKARGVFPAAARTNQGMTGSQLLAVLGSTGDQIRAGAPGDAPGTKPTVASADHPDKPKDDGDAFVDFTPGESSTGGAAQPAAKSAPAPASSSNVIAVTPASAGDAGVPHARPEPLPDSSAAKPAPQPEPNPAPSQPAPAGTGTPSPAPAPTPAPAAVPATKPVWTPGKPLQKPRPQNQGGGV